MCKCDFLGRDVRIQVLIRRPILGLDLFLDVCFILHSYLSNWFHLFVSFPILRASDGRRVGRPDYAENFSVHKVLEGGLRKFPGALRAPECMGNKDLQGFLGMEDPKVSRRAPRAGMYSMASWK